MLLLVIAPLAAFLALGYLAVWQKEGIVRRVAAELPMLVLSLLMVETLIVLWRPGGRSGHEAAMNAARQLGLPFDSRRVLEVVDHLRQTGIDALPGIARDWAQRAPVRKRLPEGLYPLSHASNVSVVECNESGNYLVYETDEYGFNNPPGLLASKRIDIAAIGESAMLGHCVPTGQSLIGRLRQTFSRTANFSMAAAGSLSNLGVFREYVEILQPRVVLWLPEFGFDEGEYRDSVLMSYLNPLFSQQLRERQREIDELIRAIAIPAQAEFERSAKLALEEVYRLSKIPSLSHLRYYLHQNLLDRADPQPNLAPIMLAKAKTEDWGGDFILLLPPVREATQKTPSLRRVQLRRMLTANGISFIDATEAFQRQPDPAALYEMRRMLNHPNARGYALIADYVAVELAKLVTQPTRTGMTLKDRKLP